MRKDSTFDTFILFSIGACVLAAFLERGCTAPIYAQDAPAVTQAQRLEIQLVSQLCVHELTWAGGRDGIPDCGAIIQVIRNRQRTRETFTQALARTSPRFFAGTSDRAWVRALPLGVLREDPAGWPATYPHARAFADRWEGVTDRTGRYYLEMYPAPCEEPVVRWFGRDTDGEELANALASGDWREAHCGGAEIQAYLYAVDAD